MPFPKPFPAILGERPAPRLWCPPLTHFTADGSFDTARMEAHWRAMRPHVGGFLVPGSTGEGWELTETETAALLDVCLGLARELDALVLVGMLRPDADDARAAIKAFVDHTVARAGTSDIPEALASLGVCGFTVCASTGKDVTPEAMQSGLEGILDLGAPTALYQLPQVTQNEVPPDMFSDLAARHPNLVLFKDSSGGDKVARQAGEHGVFMVRGAENEYAWSLAECGGPYHGMLLGSSNALHAPLAEMLGLLEAGRLDEAKALSRRLTEVMDQCFALVDGLTDANPFTNACKALDQWMAWGDTAMDRPMPMLHCGRRLPGEVVRKVGEVLVRAEMRPDKGYMGR